MTYCHECGKKIGLCVCKECVECGELAEHKCLMCGDDLCHRHSHRCIGYSQTIRFCAVCQHTLNTYKPCANPDPARKCADKNFAPELLHDCATCRRAFCAACIVETPIPGTTRLAQHHCLSCSKQQEQIVAA